MPLPIQPHEFPSGDKHRHALTLNHMKSLLHDLHCQHDKHKKKINLYFEDCFFLRAILTSSPCIATSKLGEEPRSQTEVCFGSTHRNVSAQRCFSVAMETDHFAQAMPGESIPSVSHSASLLATRCKLCEIQMSSSLSRTQSSGSRARIMTMDWQSLDPQMLCQLCWKSFGGSAIAGRRPPMSRPRSSL